MALNGTTKIELTNVKTGEVEVVEKHNLVTNAVADILNADPLNLRWDSDLFRTYSLPVLHNLIGGIVLVGDALEENPELYYIPESNPIVGYSNMEVSPDTDPKRGSLNQIESGALEDGSGYRFVFDFESSQGNGKISAVSLTSQHMGACGYSSEQYDDRATGSDYVSLAARKTAFPLLAAEECVMQNYTEANIVANIAAIDVENRCAYSIVCEAVKSISVYKIPLLTDHVGLFSKNVCGTPELMTTIQTQNFRSSHASGSTKNYYAFCDGGDGFIWGFDANSNAQTSQTIRWVKIDKSTWGIEEGQWSLPKTVYAGGGANNISSSSQSSECKILVINGFAYFFGTNYTSVVIVNTNNPTDIAVIEDTKTAMLQPNVTSNGAYLNTLGNVVYLSGSHIIGKELHAGKATQTSNRYVPGLYKTWRPNIRYGPVVFGFYAGGGANATISMWLDSSYLATINNLERPVEKTADKTMKITYILREES